MVITNDPYYAKYQDTKQKYLDAKKNLSNDSIQQTGGKSGNYVVAYNEALFDSLHAKLNGIVKNNVKHPLWNKFDSVNQIKTAITNWNNRRTTVSFPSLKHMRMAFMECGYFIKNNGQNVKQVKQVNNPKTNSALFRLLVKFVNKKLKKVDPNFRDIVISMPRVIFNIQKPDIDFNKLGLLTDQHCQDLMNQLNIGIQKQEPVVINAQRELESQLGLSEHSEHPGLFKVDKLLFIDMGALTKNKLVFVSGCNKIATDNERINIILDALPQAAAALSQEIDSLSRTDQQILYQSVNTNLNAESMDESPPGSPQMGGGPILKTLMLSVLTSALLMIAVAYPKIWIIITPVLNTTTSMAKVPQQQPQQNVQAPPQLQLPPQQNVQPTLQQNVQAPPQLQLPPQQNVQPTLQQNVQAPPQLQLPPQLQAPPLQ
jgi:hypothetical protein